MEKTREKLLKDISKNPAWTAAAFLVLVAFIAFGSYRYYVLHKTNTTNEAKIGELETNLKLREGELANARTENADLLNKLLAEQSRNNAFQDQIGQITHNVGTLVKLSQTDKELLQKYSKIYFLNENYIPSNLSLIDPKYLSTKDKPQEIHTKVLPFLTRLMGDAAAAGINLEIVSAYRSFGTQAGLKSSYKVTFGAGSANQFSAEQGYSEHQLGTTVDFTTPTVGPALNGFEKSTAYTWLTENAHRYGFILSYPKGNTYYIFEPWHWRFVGTALATKLRTAGESFYGFDQREIDQYLVSIFD